MSAPPAGGRHKPHRPGWHEFHLDGHVLLWREPEDRLHVLNPTAHDVLCALHTGQDEAEIAGNWRSRYRLPDPQAEAAAAVQALRGAGLFDAPADNPARDPAPRPRARPAVATGRAPPLRLQMGVRSIEIVAAPAELGARIAPYFAHLPAARVVPDVRFDVIAADGGYRLNGNDAELLATAAFDELLLATLFHTAECCRSDDSDLLVLHAGAVARAGRALAFTGPSGAGKSTLVAWLAEQGFDFLADDMLPIDSRSLRVRPVPACARLKEGSWPVLAPLRPELLEQPVMQDGNKTLRLLPPRPSAAWHQDHELAALVVLERAAGADAQLSAIAPVSLLQTLMATEPFLARPLTAGRIERLVHWLGATPAYRLRYGRLEEVAPLVAALLSG